MLTQPLTQIWNLTFEQRVDILWEQMKIDRGQNCKRTDAEKLANMAVEWWEHIGSQNLDERITQPKPVKKVRVKRQPKRVQV